MPRYEYSLDDLTFEVEPIVCERVEWSVPKEVPPLPIYPLPSDLPESPT